MCQTLLNSPWLQRLVDKIRHLSKECDLTFEAKKQQTVEEVAEELASVVENVVKFLIDLRSIADQYAKLQGLLQKHQADIRKHIGIEQQLRLYGESLQNQLEESEFTRFEFLEKTRVTISDLKRQNQKLHEQNMDLKQRNQQSRLTGMTAGSRLELRNKATTQESSKQRGSRSRLQTFQVEIRKPHKNDTFDSATRTPPKLNEYRLKIDKKEGRTIQPNFHSERKKDIQRKVRQLVQNRNAKKTIFQNSSSYHELYARNKTVANHAHRRSLRKSVESRGEKLHITDDLEQDIPQQDQT